MEHAVAGKEDHVSPTRPWFTVAAGAPLHTSALSFLHQEIVEGLLRSNADYRKRFTSHRNTKRWADALLSEAEADDDRLLLGFFQPSSDWHLVAVMELVRLSNEEWAIALLVVDQAQHGRGLGRQVVKSIALHSKACGVKLLSLGVEGDNHEALAFWHSLGFAHDSTLGDEGQQLINMHAIIHNLLEP